MKKILIIISALLLAISLHADASSKSKHKKKKKTPVVKKIAKVNPDFSVDITVPQETDTFAIEKGGSLTLKLVNGGGLTFKWQFKLSGKDWQPILATEKWADLNTIGKNKLLLIHLPPNLDKSQIKCSVSIGDKNIASQIFLVKSITGITKLEGIFKVGNEVTINSNVPSAEGFDYQWKEDAGSGIFNNLPGENKPQLKFNLKDISYNNRRYLCVVSDKNGGNVESNIDTLKLTGCISQFPNNVSPNNKVSFIVNHSDTTGLFYRWRVNPNNSGNEFIDITANDSDIYAGFNKDTLVVKNPTALLNGSVYKCEIYSKRAGLISTDTCTMRMEGKIGYYPNESRLMFMAAYYSGIQGIKDDNADNLTQIYLRSSIYLKTHPIDLNAESRDRLFWFRNLYIQTTYSTNVNSLKYFNINDTTFSRQDTAKYRGVNRLDLLKNATWNINFMVPVITYFFGAYRPHFGDIAHLYVDPFAAFLITTVNSKNLKDTVNPIHVYSAQYGLNVGIRFEDLKLNRLPIYLEINSKIFWISTLSNSINPNLNYQESKIINDHRPNYSENLMAKYNNPYLNLDGLIMYYLSSSSTSNVFLHMSFFTNIVNPSFGNVYNNYWQLQGGYALDINSFWSKLNPKKS